MARTSPHYPTGRRRLAFFPADPTGACSFRDRAAHLERDVESIAPRCLQTESHLGRPRALRHPTLPVQTPLTPTASAPHPDTLSPSHTSPISVNLNPDT